MLDISKAIRIDKYLPPNHDDTGPKNVYIFKCANCDNEIKIKGLSRLNTATGLCVKCNNKRMHPKALERRRLRRFGAIFNRLNDSAKSRNIGVYLTFDQFLEFTLFNYCHYCNGPIKWKPYGVSSYNLDRKNNNDSYNVNNLVTCCSRCNKGKREIYTYEEWYGMTAYFRERGQND